MSANIWGSYHTEKQQKQILKTLHGAQHKWCYTCCVPANLWWCHKYFMRRRSRKRKSLDVSSPYWTRWRPGTNRNCCFRVRICLCHFSWEPVHGLHRWTQRKQLNPHNPCLCCMRSSADCSCGIFSAIGPPTYWATKTEYQKEGATGFCCTRSTRRRKCHAHPLLSQLSECCQTLESPLKAFRRQPSKKLQMFQWTMLQAAEETCAKLWFPTGCVFLLEQYKCFCGFLFGMLLVWAGREGRNAGWKLQSLSDTENTIVHRLIFALAVIGNSVVLIVLGIRRKKLSRMNLMIVHLSIADLFVAFFNVLPQLIWDITFRLGTLKTKHKNTLDTNTILVFAFTFWSFFLFVFYTLGNNDLFRFAVASDALCRMVKYFQVVAMYASSYVLVSTAIDRYLAICHPLISQVRRA